ncbi:MAG: hypothetical protein M3425_06145 [Actinomycetota bacterium]|nr:hypothetical protein [Actinomycetota bacterium]
MNSEGAPRWRTIAMLAVVLVVCCGLAAVGFVRLGRGRDVAAAPSSAASSAASVEPALVVDVEKPRYLVAERMVEVIVVNKGASPVRVEQIQLFGRLFKAQPPIAKDTLLQPDERKDLKVGYGEVRCGRQAPTSSEPFVRLRVRASDGNQSRARLALPSPSPTLQRLHDTECGLLALREAVQVRYGPGWTRAGRGYRDARGRLVLRRRASREPIVLTAVGGNVIFTVTAHVDDSPQRPQRDPQRPQRGPQRPQRGLQRPQRVSQRALAILRPGDERLTVPVAVAASRCDAHAVADSKKTFLLPLWLRVGAAEEQYLEVEVTGRGRRLLTDVISDCVAAEQG